MMSVHNILQYFQSLLEQVFVSAVLSMFVCFLFVSSSSVS